MTKIGPTIYWGGISIGYLILSISTLITWLKLKKLHNELEHPTILTTGGVSSGGVAFGGEHKGPRINVEKMFLQLVSANLIALFLSATGTVLTFVQF